MAGHFRRSVEGGGEGPPNMDMILATAEEIASGMAFLHTQGIIHGDLTGGELAASRVLLGRTTVVGADVEWNGRQHPADVLACKPAWVLRQDRRCACGARHVGS